MPTKFYPGSMGEAASLALRDEAFRARAMAFAEMRETLMRELSQAETGHHEMRGRVCCTETSRIDAGWGNHPGYLIAWFSLRTFRVRLLVSHDRASLDAFESRNKAYESGQALHVPLIEDNRRGRNHVEQLGCAWTAQNPLFWHALALVHETTHPQLCPSCHRARIKHDGSTCKCLSDDRICMSRSVTVK